MLSKFVFDDKKMGSVWQIHLSVQWPWNANESRPSCVAIRGTLLIDLQLRPVLNTESEIRMFSRGISCDNKIAIQEWKMICFANR